MRQIGDASSLPPASTFPRASPSRAPGCASSAGHSGGTAAPSGQGSPSSLRSQGTDSDTAPSQLREIRLWRMSSSSRLSYSSSRYQSVHERPQKYSCQPWTVTVMGPNQQGSRQIRQTGVGILIHQLALHDSPHPTHALLGRLRQLEGSRVALGVLMQLLQLLSGAGGGAPAALVGGVEPPDAPRYTTSSVPLHSLESSPIRPHCTTACCTCCVGFVSGGRGLRLGPVGIEPTTVGLKVRWPRCRAVRWRSPRT